MKEKIKTIIITILIFIPSIVAGIFIFLFNTEKNKDIKKQAKNKKEEMNNEIKNTSASDIIAGSSNQSIISESINNEREQLRKRIRDRLNKNIQ